MTDDNIPIEGEATDAPPPESADLDIPLDGDALFASIMGEVGAGEDAPEVPQGGAAADPAAAEMDSSLLRLKELQQKGTQLLHRQQEMQQSLLWHETQVTSLRTGAQP